MEKGQMSFHPLTDTDPVTTDPALTDPEFPAEHFVTHFFSKGSVVHALVWIAQGRGAKATVIISPQAFGGDRLESLIIPLLNAGVNVLTFHPRGMWDGNGEYSPLSALDDVHAAVEFLRTAEENGKRTSAGNGYRVDPARIGVLGLSGGGGTVGFVSCAENEAINFAIALAPANYELHRDLTILDHGSAAFDFVKSETAGRVDVEKRARAMRPEEIDRLSIITQAPKLVDKKLLLVAGSQDSITPVEYCHRPIVEGLENAGAAGLTEVVLDSDHFFLNKRVALARLVISWLRSEVVI